MGAVPGYAGQNQSAHINVPASIAYKYIDWEESCWVMPPYAWFYPGPPSALSAARPAVRTPLPAPRRIRWVSGLYE